MPNLASVNRPDHMLSSLIFGVNARQLSSMLSDATDLKYQATIQNWFSDRQHGLVVTLDRIVGLFADDEEDHPTKAAVSHTAWALMSAYQQMSNFFPRGWATTSPDAGIRIEWAKVNRHVRLAISGEPERLSYIYFEENGVYGSEAVSARALATRLDWLLRA